MHKFVRTGEDYSATMFTGLTLAAATSVTGTTFQINGGFTAHTNDLVVIDAGGTFRITSGITGAAVGGKSEVTVNSAIGATYPIGTVLSLQTRGITRGTSGIAGSTFESFRSGTVVNGGFTACVFFGGATGSTGTIS